MKAIKKTPRTGSQGLKYPHNPVDGIKIGNRSKKSCIDKLSKKVIIRDIGIIIIRFPENFGSFSRYLSAPLIFKFFSLPSKKTLIAKSNFL